MEKNELKELLIKSWMTHDGMWFYHCLEECGIDKTNKINKAAIKSISKIEIKRIRKIFGINSIKNFEDIKTTLEKALEVFKADFMEFTHTFIAKTKMHCEMINCWAYEGVKGMGVIDRYECGVHTRIEGWLEALEIEFEVKPPINGCLMNQVGNCSRDFIFQLK
ncbi:MAG: DUF6125 family protein [Candidatus Odinarchaeota archaeon]